MVRGQRGKWHNIEVGPTPIWEVGDKMVPSKIVPGTKITQSQAKQQDIAGNLFFFSETQVQIPKGNLTGTVLYHSWKSFDCVQLIRRPYGNTRSYSGGTHTGHEGEADQEEVDAICHKYVEAEVNQTNKVAAWKKNECWGCGQDEPPGISKNQVPGRRLPGGIGLFQLIFYSLLRQRLQRATLAASNLRVDEQWLEDKLGKDGLVDKVLHFPKEKQGEYSWKRQTSLFYYNNFSCTPNSLHQPFY